MYIKFKFTKKSHVCCKKIIHAFLAPCEHPKNNATRPHAPAPLRTPLSQNISTFILLIRILLTVSSKNFDLSKLLEQSSNISLKQQMNFVWRLSIPGVIAQISSIIMQYIDAAMVGSLGANASASIGLVASSIWVISSLSHALCIGFTVQVAHAVGAGEQKKAKKILIQSIYVCIMFSVFLAGLSALLCKKLPVWLGGAPEILSDASNYFLIFGLSTPFFILVTLMTGMLQCSGNMKLPAVLNACLCFLDIIFNSVFIFVFKLGVTGAAIGSACSALVVAAIIVFYTLLKSEYLNLRGFNDFSLNLNVVAKALKIGMPIAVESSAFTGALVVVAKMVAPLGSVALSANSFATTAEALCYMPGYGIQEAAITLVGQSAGARRKDLTRSFSFMTVISGMLVMTLAGVLMYFICPYVFNFLTPDNEIRALSIKVLRIELFAEPMYAAAIVASGALRGKGDTLVPGILSLISLWGVRIVLSILLIKPFGLTGIWISMTVELCFRGLVMLLRLFCFKSKKN